MITREQAMTLTMFYHRDHRNADGTAARWRRNGRTQTWKTRPDDYRVPVKYGLKSCDAITPDAAYIVMPFDPTSHQDAAEYAGLTSAAPWAVVADKLRDMGEPENADYIARTYCGMAAAV